MNKNETAFLNHPVVAVIAPITCLVHCLAAPALVVVAPAVVENRAVESGLMGMSLAFGAYVVRQGFRRHEDSRVWIPLLLAALVFLGNWTGCFAGVAVEISTAAGSLLVLAAIGWSARLQGACACPGCNCVEAALGGRIEHRADWIRTKMDDQLPAGEA